MPLPDLGTLHPVALVEADVHYIPTEAEGESGFQLRRLYLGLRWAPAPWATVVGSLNPAAREHDPLIVDGTVRFTPPGPVDVSLGYGKTPLFASAHDSSIDSLAIPELSLSTGAFWPGRDLGAELHLGAPTLPVEVWLRLGNGSGSPAGNDNRHFSMDIRTDLSFGRVRIGAERSTPMGFRLGGGFHLEEAE
ncbi:MAG TPA: hypothetical protein PLA94_16640, partial [Myxococcota bacterium]|nr:hypothetical protein [Myxococcota bacterium]